VSSGAARGDLAFLSATELAGRIRRRELSPVELLEACIERIEERNPLINAFVYTAFDEARAAARRAEQAALSGDELGPLHGVPTAIKDLFDSKPGWPWTCGGVRALEGFTVDADSLWVRRMERAGAIIVGRTNSPVLGFRGTCDNPLYGPTRNPFDVSKNSGGSSGGAAAAVADGMLPLAEATDAGGSIRIPAAWCGVYGLKPGAGRVPVVMRPNAFGNASPFVHEGVVARTVEDAAVALDALAGPDPRDPLCHGELPGVAHAVGRSIEGLRIAYSPNFDVFPVDPRIAECVGTAVRAFEEAGATVEQVRLGITHDQRELSDVWCRLTTLLNIDVIESFKREGRDLVGDHRDDFPPELLHWLERGYRMTALDLLQDQHIRAEVFDALQAVFENYDLIVTPTLAAMPVGNAADGCTKGPSEIEGVAVDPLIGWCMTYPVNFTGHPAASIPAGLVDGLPVGMQLIGRRLREDDVIAASAAFERLRPWGNAYPGRGLGGRTCDRSHVERAC
jgi:amidase